MIHAVIMAGGAGTRFWPASRADEPKQLLRLAGPTTMIQATVKRLGDLVPADQVLIVTNKRLVEAIARQLPQLPQDSVIGEPCKRDTAPCIGLAALVVSREDSEATMVVMPSDHVIQDQEEFRAAIREAAWLVDESPGRIVTFGIRPTYAAESFGYIEHGDRLADSGSDSDISAFRVQQFREKPKAEVARQYVEAGNFFWNSGIFVWKAATILDHLSQRQPKMVEHLQKIVDAWGESGFNEIFDREFAAIDGISIDYAVMEHATDVVVIEAPFDWDDLGSWQSLPRLLGEDTDGNTVDAKHLGLKTSNCIIRGEESHLIATLGVSNLIVVQTPGATLVADRNEEESIRKLVKLIEDRGWNEYL